MGIMDSVKFRIFPPLSRVLGSEDTEDAEVTAARPVVSRETADTCHVAVLSVSGMNSCDKN